MYLAFISDYVVNALSLRIHPGARLNHTLRCSRAIISRTEIVSGPARTRRVNNHSCRAFAREDAELPPRALARLHQIGGCYLQEQLWAVPRARRESSRNTFAENFPPPRVVARERQKRLESAMIVAITRARIYILRSPPLRSLLRERYNRSERRSIILMGRLFGIYHDSLTRRDNLVVRACLFARNQLSKRRCGLNVARDYSSLSHLSPFLRLFPTNRSDKSRIK